MVLLEFSSRCASGRMPACVRIVESHICTNCLRIHLERVRPLIFEVVKLLPMLSNGTWLHPEKTEICFQSLPTQDLKNMRSPNFSARRPLTRDLTGFALLNCRMGMSSPCVDRGHKFFQEYPNEKSSS